VILDEGRHPIEPLTCLRNLGQLNHGNPVVPAEVEKRPEVDGRPMAENLLSNLARVKPHEFRQLLAYHADHSPGDLLGDQG